MELAGAVAPLRAAEAGSVVTGYAPLKLDRPFRTAGHSCHTVTTSFPKRHSRLLCRAAREVNMVDPIEAKRLAEEQLRIIRQKESEAVSGTGRVGYVRPTATCLLAVGVVYC